MSAVVSRLPCSFLIHRFVQLQDIPIDSLQHNMPNVLFNQVSRVFGQGFATSGCCCFCSGRATSQPINLGGTVFQQPCGVSMGSRWVVGSVLHRCSLSGMILRWPLSGGPLELEVLQDEIFLRFRTDPGQKDQHLDCQSLHMRCHVAKASCS